MLDVNQIMEILPHRYPFLLVDRVLEFEFGKRIVGIKNTTITEPFFQGHFPGHPVMPGVLMIEALAQLSGVMLLSYPEAKGKIAYFAAINNVRFRRPVKPGDQIRLEVDLLKIKGPVSKTQGKAFVDGKVVVEVEMTFSLADTQVEKRIDATANIHPSAEIGKDVAIGPYAFIGEGVKLCNGVIIEANVVIEKWTTIGEDTHIHYGTIIGNTTQDKKFKGDKSYVEIGARNDIREYCTINRATSKDGVTRIGDDNFFLTYVHVAHNCEIGNNVIISNTAQIAGHVKIGNNVNIGGMAGIRQFTRIGDFTMIGGYTSVRQDVPPFMLVEGNPGIIRSFNAIGAERNGVSKSSRKALKDCYKILYRSKLNFSQAVEKIKSEVEQIKEVKQLVSFLGEKSANGIMHSKISSEENGSEAD